MAVNIKIVEQLVHEVIQEHSGINPYMHYVYDEKTKSMYEVTVAKVTSKKSQYISESKLATAKYTSATGAPGVPC